MHSRFSGRSGGQRFPFRQQKNTTASRSGLSAHPHSPVCWTTEPAHSKKGCRGRGSDPSPLLRRFHLPAGQGSPNRLRATPKFYHRRYAYARDFFRRGSHRPCRAYPGGRGRHRAHPFPSLTAPCCPPCPQGGGGGRHRAPPGSTRAGQQPPPPGQGPHFPQRPKLCFCTVRTRPLPFQGSSQVCCRFGRHLDRRLEGRETVQMRIQRTDQPPGDGQRHGTSLTGASS